MVCIVLQDSKSCINCSIIGYVARWLQLVSHTLLQYFMCACRNKLGIVLAPHECGFCLKGMWFGRFLSDRVFVEGISSAVRLSTWQLCHQGAFFSCFFTLDALMIQSGATKYSQAPPHIVGRRVTNFAHTKFYYCSSIYHCGHQYSTVVAGKVLCS